MRSLFMAMALLFPAACWPDSGPERMSLSTGAPRGAPVLTHSLKINGVETVRLESVKASGWSDPKGDRVSLTGYPSNPDDADTVTVLATWTDLFANTGFEARVTTDVRQLARPEQRTNTVVLIIVMGPNGYLELATDAPPDARGQYNGKVLATACGVQRPGLPADHTVWSSPRYQRLSTTDRPAPPSTPCAN